MISPYVRRLRLATEVRALRADAGLTADQLGKRIGRSRADISRLENGHVVDQADIIAILDALGVDGDRWTQIVTIAREAGERGWWESNKAMGDRQALYANLEAGAATIREYQQTFVPGLLQTPEFVRSRVDTEVTLKPGSPNATASWPGASVGSACCGVRAGRPTRSSSTRWRSAAWRRRPRWSRSSSITWPPR